MFLKCSGRISGCWKIHPLCPVRDRPAGGLLLHLDAFTRFNIKKRQLSQDTRRIRKVRSCTQIYLQHTYHTQSHWMSHTHRALKPEVSLEIIKGKLQQLTLWFDIVQHTVFYSFIFKTIFLLTHRGWCL